MGRGWKLFEALKDVVSPEDILEEMARNMSDQELLDAIKEVANNFDVELNVTAIHYNKYNFHKVKLLEHFNDCSKCIDYDTCILAKKGYICNRFDLR